MRKLFCALVLAAVSAAPAIAAQEAPPADTGRTLYICDASAMTKRAFAREFGRAEFVTAEQVREGGNWDAPKCITRSEARKLKQLASNKLKVAAK